MSLTTPTTEDSAGWGEQWPQTVTWKNMILDTVPLNKSNSLKKIMF